MPRHSLLCCFRILFSSCVQIQGRERRSILFSRWKDGSSIGGSRCWASERFKVIEVTNMVLVFHHINLHSLKIGAVVGLVLWNLLYRSKFVHSYKTRCERFFVSVAERRVSVLYISGVSCSWYAFRFQRRTRDVRRESWETFARCYWKIGRDIISFDRDGRDKGAARLIY